MSPSAHPRLTVFKIDVSKLSINSIRDAFRENWDYVGNIARGTTDPEIDSVTWIKFSNNMAPLALVAYFITRWRHLH